MKLLEYFVGITHQLGTITRDLQYIERAKFSKNVRLAQELNFPETLSVQRLRTARHHFQQPPRRGSPQLSGLLRRWKGICSHCAAPPQGQAGFASCREEPLLT